MKPQPQNFKTLVKKRLIDLGMTTTRLAERIGKERNTVSIAINHDSMFLPTKALIRKELGLS